MVAGYHGNGKNALKIAKKYVRAGQKISRHAKHYWLIFSGVVYTR